MDYFEDVRQFHLKFGLDAHPHVPPQLLPSDVMDFRIYFMIEELDELQKAYNYGDIAGVADALADLVYVALGTAHMSGLPMHDIWAEVQRANMAKERAREGDPRSKRRHRLDVVKPEGWRAPDHTAALSRAAAAHRGE